MPIPPIQRFGLEVFYALDCRQRFAADYEQRV